MLWQHLNVTVGQVSFWVCKNRGILMVKWPFLDSKINFALLSRTFKLEFCLRWTLMVHGSLISPLAFSVILTMGELVWYFRMLKNLCVLMEWGKQNQIWFVYVNETTLNNENMTCMENIFHFFCYMLWNDIYSGLVFHPSHELDCGITNHLLKHMWKETT